MERCERLQMAVNYLKSIGLVKTQQDVADTIGTARPNITRALKGNEGYTSDKFMVRFNSAFGDIFSTQWLLKGEGSMLLCTIKNSSLVLSYIYNKVGTLETLAQKMELQTTDGLQEVLDGKRNFEPHEVERICKAFPELKREWVETGEGEPTDESCKTLNLKQPGTSSNSTKYFKNVFALMGAVEYLSDTNEDFEYISIPHFERCQYAINVEGDSMKPMFNDGEILLIDDWKESFIEWGRVYLLITRNGHRVVKRLYESESEGMVVCHSENPIYKDFEAELEGAKLFLVKGAVSIKKV